jgi:ParB family chromosome partitioning protein
MTAGHAKALLSLGSQSLQLALCREIMARGLSVREAERRVRKLLKTPDAQLKVREPVIDLQTRELEEKLRLHLGLQVKVLPKSNVAGKIEVYYSSLDDFRGFFDHLGISLEQES